MTGEGMKDCQPVRHAPGPYPFRRMPGHLSGGGPVEAAGLRLLRFDADPTRTAATTERGRHDRSATDEAAGRAAVRAVAAVGHRRDPGQRLVVVLYPEDTDGSPGVVAVDRGIRAAFLADSPADVEVRSEYVETAAGRGADVKRLQLGYLRQKYAGRRVDLVIAVLSPALDFALAHRAELFPGSPVVFCAIDEREIRRVNTHVGHGIVGGRVFNFETEGRSAARLAQRILDGEGPGGMAVPGPNENTDTFDARQLRRWGGEGTRPPAGQRDPVPRADLLGRLPLARHRGGHPLYGGGAADRRPAGPPGPAAAGRGPAAREPAGATTAGRPAAGCPGLMGNPRNCYNCVCQRFLSSFGCGVY